MDIEQRKKDLPMYLTEEYDNKKELIGYRIYCHPIHRSSKKFCNKYDLKEAYQRAMIYLTELNKHLQGMDEVQRLDGNGSSSVKA